VEHLAFAWDRKTVRIGIERQGSGPTLLLLPALSSISTRGEMRPLQERLSSAYATIAVDWPGFGDEPRPAVAWRPETYRAFLRHVLAQVVVAPFATVAAGHSAGYLLAQAAEAPGSAGRLCLIAPTWRGPLPTMMNGKRAAFRWLARAVDVPLLGQAFYRLNVSQPVIRRMVSGHVYDDPTWLTDARLAHKRAVTSAPGARHSSFRFVAGALDPMPSRSAFLQAAERVSDPMLVVYGANTPRRSKAEMDALAALKNVRAVRLSVGKLSAHEEFPDLVAGAIQSFLELDSCQEVDRSAQGTTA
jgi:pimeloyl-ACP methyl ester carboxylesterase